MTFSDLSYPIMSKNEELIALAESDRTARGAKDFADQSFALKVFWAVWSLEEQVNNGGFSQYFQSESADTASFVVLALETIGAGGTAEICKQAITTAFPSGLPDNAEEISDAAAEFSSDTESKLEELDEAFYQYPHDLTNLLYEFVLKHPQTFGKPPFGKRGFWPFRDLLRIGACSVPGVEPRSRAARVRS